MPENRPARSIFSRIASIFSNTASVFSNNTLKHTVVFLFRSFYQFDLSTRWIGFLEDYSRQQRLGPPPVELVRKAFGAYFTMNRSVKERELLLETHYRLAALHLPETVLKALWDGRQTELCRVSGKKDNYIVWLRRADQSGTRHEGEWTAGFECMASGLQLCRITFILADTPQGGVAVAVGGLQGPAREVPKTALVSATRDLGGLRPKDAMVLVVAGLSSALGSSIVYAIDNDSHPINYRARRRRSRMLTDYDNYWRDRGGEPGGPFGFELPVKDPAEAEPGNKRRDDAKKAFFQGGRMLLTEPKSDRRESAGG